MDHDKPHLNSSTIEKRKNVICFLPNAYNRPHIMHITLKSNKTPNLKLGFVKTRLKLKTQYNSIQTISINQT